MKTISELNGKTWYRLLKVLYILFILLVFTGLVVFIYDENSSRFNINKSYISCDNGKNLSLVESNIILDKNGFVDYKNEEKLSALCDGLKADVLISEDLWGDSLSWKIIRYYDNKIWNTIGFSIIILLVIVVINEIIRRVFYYIVLGTLKPNNK